MIDIIDPVEPYSVWDFVQQSRAVGKPKSVRGRIPLLVGGTMMYCHAFEQGLNRLPEADKALRRRLNHEAQQQVGSRNARTDWPAIDPVSADRIKPTDSQRIQRALEVYEISGEPLSGVATGCIHGGLRWRQIEKIMSWAASDRAGFCISGSKPGFWRCWNRDLSKKSSQPQEARGDLNLSLPSMRCVGYRQIWQYLDGENCHISR